MEALYLLVPLSIGLVFVAIWAFFWMSDNGQFDDLVGPGLRILEDRDDAVEVDRSAERTADQSGGQSAHRSVKPSADSTDR